MFFNQQFMGSQPAAEEFMPLIQSIAQTYWETAAQGIVVADAPSWRAFTGQTPEQ